MSGLSGGDSVGKGLSPSGRAVLFAGLTVIIALLGMFALGLSCLDGMAIGAALTVAMTVLAATTLLPALLGLMKLRVLRRKQRRQLAAQETALETQQSATAFGEIVGEEAAPGRARS